MPKPVSMSRLRLDVHAEGGLALVMALGVLCFFSVATVTAIRMTSSTQNTAATSKASQLALANAEAGVANVEAILNGQNSNASSPTLLGCSRSGQNVNNSALPCTDLTVSLPSGSAGFHGLYTQGAGTTGTWVITSTGSVPRPHGRGSLTRAVTATITVAVGGQDNNISVWNYVYSTAPNDGNHSTCEVDLNQDHTEIQVPVYVTGDLCLSGNHASIEEEKGNGGQAIDIRVMGGLTISGDHAMVGCATPGGHPPPPPDTTCGPGQSTVTSGYVALGCRTTTNGTFHPCTTADDYWVSQTDTPLTASAPVTDFPGWYLGASPGPKYPCDPARTPAPMLTTTKPHAFDGDGTMNGTNTIFDLTPTGPNSSYNCVTSTGTLNWDSTKNVLTISGTIFFDGDVYVSDPPGPAEAVYQGKATIYVNGQLSFNSDGKPGPGGAGGLRAACTNGPGPGGPHGNLQPCDMNGGPGNKHWDPNANMITFVANKQTGTAIDLSEDHSEFQGDLLCPPGATAALAGDHTQVEGGIICGRFTFGNHTQIFPMPTITTLPPGAPLPPNAPATISAPTFTG